MLKHQQTLGSRNLKPTQYALKILEILIEHGINGLNLTQVTDQLGTTRSTTHRYLHTLVESGWVESAGTQSNMVWKPSNHFIKLAFNYRNAIRNQVELIEAEFKNLTGEDL